MDVAAKVVENVGTVRLVGGESLVSRRTVFSKDSKILFCCCGRRIRVYSALTGDLLRELKGHQSKVTDAKISPRNQLQLVSCSLDGTVILWDYTDGIILKKYQFSSNLVGLLLHPFHENCIFLIKEMRRDKKKAGYMLGVFNVKSEKGNKQHMKTVLEVSEDTKQCALSGKGDYLACTKGNSLCLWHFPSEKLKMFAYKRATFTCVAFHPQEMCIATGDNAGKIVLWQGVDHPGDPVTVELHWHAHALSDLAFTSDGSYILSGGEESVLVLWQYKTHNKQFLPRLGAPIKHVCSNSDDTLIAVSHTDNAVRLVSGVELKVIHTIQGLGQGTAEAKKLGIVFDPRSKALITNNMPGILQFYLPQTDHHVSTFNISRQNYISRTGKERMFFTQIEHVTFSENGLWMATIEQRDDKRTVAELRLKFWEFDTATQSYALNTCVDPPHEKKVVSVHFQPQGKQMEDRQPVAMTASKDGKFKMWTLREDRALGGKKSAWCCHSVGYYGDIACQDAAFSDDGSLLAVAYGQYFNRENSDYSLGLEDRVKCCELHECDVKEQITLWDPETNELRKTLSLPYPSEKIRKVCFGHNSSSQYLIVLTQKFLTVWNLLTCSVWWSIEAKVTELVADPSGPYIAAFVIFNNNKTHLYIFDPSTPRPVAVQANVLKKVNIMSAAFDPSSSIIIRSNGKSIQLSKLYFLNRKQELFTVDEDGDKEGEAEEEEESAVPRDLSKEIEEQQSAFLKIFGHPVRTGDGTTAQTGGRVVRGTPSSVAVKQMLNTPAHVLPPVTALCSVFLKSLLVSRHPENSSLSAGREESQDSDVEDERMDSDNSDSEDESRDHELKLSQSQTPQLMDTSPGPEQEVDDESLDTEDFSWLQEYFKN